MIDKKKLLAWLKERQTFYGHSLIIGAVLGGLITAVERGDFDTRKEE